MDISKLKKKGKKHVGNYIGHNPTTINSLLYDLLALRNITLITIIILSFLDLAQLLRGALNPSGYEPGCATLPPSFIHEQNSLLRQFINHDLSIIVNALTPYFLMTASFSTTIHRNDLFLYRNSKSNSALHVYHLADDSDVIPSNQLRT